MQPILLKNASTVLTMAPRGKTDPLGTLRDVDILVHTDGSILAMGPGLQCPEAKKVDIEGCTVMPGFVNAHDHLWQTLIRGLAHDQGLPGWLPQMRARAAAIDRDDADAAVMLGAAHMLNMGVTTVLDWSHATNAGFLSGNIAALTRSGLRWQLANAGPQTNCDPAAMSDAAMQMHFGTHPIADNIHEIVRKGRMASEADKALNVHFLECREQLAEKPTELLAHNVPARTRLILNHAVHCGQTHLDLLSKFRLGVVHCPLSNMRLASGIVDLDLFNRNAIPVGLGLDGGTNDAGDMFECMRAAIGLQRAASEDACSAKYAATRALYMATQGGAHVMGLESDIGSLVPGKRADIMVLDPETYNASPGAPDAAAVVACMNASNVKHVLVDGVFKKENGRVLHGEKDLFKKARAAAGRVEAAMR